MPKQLNHVRKIYSQVGSKFDCVAYSYANNGTPNHLAGFSSTPIGVSGAKLVAEFGNQAEYSISGTQVHAPLGTESSQDPRWNTAIDGKRGFNVTCTIDAAALELPRGWYRLVITFANGSVQEFSISLRD